MLTIYGLRGYHVIRIIKEGPRCCCCETASRILTIFYPLQVWTDVGTYERSLARSYVDVSAWWVTKFSYPWCFARALRARSSAIIWAMDMKPSLKSKIMVTWNLVNRKKLENQTPSDPHYYRLLYMYADVRNDHWTFLPRNDSSNYRWEPALMVHNN